MRGVILGAAASLLGFGAGWVAAPRASSPAAVPAAAAGGVVALDTTAMRGDIRRVLREELRAARDAPDEPEGARPAEPVLAPEPEPPPAPRAEQLAARQAVDELVARARSARHWGAAEAEAFGPLAATLTREQRAEVMATLLPAVNAGEVTVDPDLVIPF